MKELTELKSQNHKLRMEQQTRDQLQEKRMTNLEEVCGINYGNGKLGTEIEYFENNPHSTLVQLVPVPQF